MDMAEVNKLIGDHGSKKALSDAAGVSASSLTRWSTGERPVTIDGAAKLRAAPVAAAVSTPALEVVSSGALDSEKQTGAVLMFADVVVLVDLERDPSWARVGSRHTRNVAPTPTLELALRIVAELPDDLEVA